MSQIQLDVFLQHDIVSQELQLDFQPKVEGGLQPISLNEWPYIRSSLSDSVFERIRDVEEWKEKLTEEHQSATIKVATVTITEDGDLENIQMYILSPSDIENL